MNPAKPFSSSLHLNHTEWVRFLAHVKPTRENDELLLAFFLREFGADPGGLSSFLVWLKTWFSHAAPAERTAVAAQYLRVLSALCERFGLFAQKQEMDLVCFEITDPAGYRSTATLLVKYKAKSKRTVDRITRLLRNLLKSWGFACEVSGRYKHLFSIHRKLKSKGYDSPLKLQDIFAFRIILESSDPQTCFRVLNELHDHYSPVADRFKDYVSIPKVNGYQSIHTVLHHVLPDLDLPVEIQIRTRAMDEFAEHGLASHWLYSRSKKTQLLGVQERKLLRHFRSLAEGTGAECTSMYCLTPAGQILDLPLGATAKDFAYRVHTELGIVAVGAEINGVQKPIDHPLKHGDSVRIITPPRTHGRQS